MKNNKEEKTWGPPYVSYKTFINFLERLKASGIPTRIDRSVMPTYAGAIQGHLFTTLKYLHLMSQHNIPTEKLTKLVASEGAERQKTFKDILVTSYQFLFKDGVDLQRITSDELQKLFDKEGVSGGTIRKAIVFFKEVAKDAGLELSPYIGKIRASGSRSNGRKSKKTNEDKMGGVSSPKDREFYQEQPNKQDWQNLLLAKFPNFDPAWPDDVKTKWFEGFKELMDEFKKQ